MNIYEKLLTIQNELKAPKGQENTFGHYNYRSCEDILEAVKPICLRQKTLLLLSDAIKSIDGRYYVEATAKLINVEKPEETIYVLAYAREEESKKGMDGSQVTGASSSYARKYALNGLFNIDDTKDSDSTCKHGQDEPAKPKPVKEQESAPTIITDKQLAYAKNIIIKGGSLKGEKLGDLTDEELLNIIDGSGNDFLIKFATIVLEDREEQEFKPVSEDDLPF